MGNYIRRKRLVVSLPLPTYESLQELAKKTDQTVAGYARQLIVQHVADLDLPVFLQEEISSRMEKG